MAFDLLLFRQLDELSIDPNSLKEPALTRVGRQARSSIYRFSKALS